MLTAVKVGLALLSVVPPAYKVTYGENLNRVDVVEKSVVLHFDGTIRKMNGCTAVARPIYDIPFNPEIDQLEARAEPFWDLSLSGVTIGGVVIEAFDVSKAHQRGQTVSECGEDCAVLASRVEVKCE